MFLLPDLTSIGPCIVIYFYSKTNYIHQIIKFILFGVTLYMFRTVFPCITSSSRLYIQKQAYVKQILLSVCLLASRQQCLFGCCMYSVELLMMDGKTVRNM